MATETKESGAKSSLISQIFVGVVIAILAGGTSPWWYSAISGKSTPKPDSPVAPANVSPQTATPAPQLATPAPQLATAASQPVDHPASQPIASREFFVGRWRVDSTQDGVHSVNTVDYYENGRFSGHDLMGNLYGGRDVPESGNWQVDTLGAQNFHLMIRYDTGLIFNGDFKILDQDHIQNVDQNYVAERVK